MSIIQLMISMPIIGRRVMNQLIKNEGGEKLSISLREYVKRNYNVEVGLYSYGSCFKKEFNTGGSVCIGRYCSFGDCTRYFGANHPIDQAVMSAWFYNREFSGFDVKDVPRKHINIGNDVWVGHGVLITNSCEVIGNGAVLAAGSVVTHNVLPYSIVAGNPAKVLRYRFDEKTISLLERSKWWTKTPDELIQYYKYMNSPKDFARILLEE